MKVIISSHFPFNITGYANQTLYMIDYLLKQNIEIPALICWNCNFGINGISYTLKHLLDTNSYNTGNISTEFLEKIHNINIYGSLENNFPCQVKSTEMINNIVKREECDLVIFHQDMFVFSTMDGKFNFPSIIFCPIHYTPMESNTNASLRHFDVLLGMSDFGYNILKNAYSNKYIEKLPLSVNINIFNKGSKDKNYYKELLGFDKSNFVCLIIGSNTETSNRKAFKQNINAFIKLYKKKKNCRLYLHTDVNGTINLLKILKKEKINKSIYKYCDNKIRDSNSFSTLDIANIYRGCDVLLNASKSEGFGIPILEAQACGCSVVTTDFSNMPEITCNGITTKYALKEYWKKGEDAYWVVPSENNIYNALNEIYNWTDEYREKLKEDGIEFAKTYSNENIGEKLVNLCKKIYNKEIILN